VKQESHQSVSVISGQKSKFLLLMANIIRISSFRIDDIPMARNACPCKILLQQSLEKSLFGVITLKTFDFNKPPTKMQTTHMEHNSIRQQTEKRSKECQCPNTGLDILSTADLSRRDK
jgi:hypothetical protein